MQGNPGGWIQFIPPQKSLRGTRGGAGLGVGCVIATVQSSCGSWMGGHVHLKKWMRDLGSINGEGEGRGLVVRSSRGGTGKKALLLQPCLGEFQQTILEDGSLKGRLGIYLQFTTP